MILIVEDNKALRLMIKKALEGEDYKSRTAANGKEGLSVLDDEIPELIISDVVMPEMDGFEFLEEVRKKYSTIPFVFLTIKSEIDDYKKGYELGATDYITKPFEMKTLISKVKKRLKSRNLINRIMSQEIDTLSLEDIMIIDLLFFLKEKKSDCTININSPDGNGSLKIVGGEVKRGSFKDSKGIDALSRISGIKQGKITIIFN